MRKIIILGWGNSQRQDDGLARIALERLELTGLPPEVELVHADQLLPEHAAIANQTDVLIFVDASTTGPQEIRVERVCGRKISESVPPFVPILTADSRDCVESLRRLTAPHCEGDFRIWRGVGFTEELLPSFVTISRMFASSRFSRSVRRSS
jgi:hypothetical protein